MELPILQNNLVLSFSMEYHNLTNKILFFQGWVAIPIKDGSVKCIRTFMLQIAVISNHQNGRDTHMRQIRIHAPVEDRHYPLELFGKFSTVNFQKFATLR